MDGTAAAAQRAVVLVLLHDVIHDSGVHIRIIIGIIRGKELRIILRIRRVL